MAKSCHATRKLIENHLGTFEPIRRLLEEFMEFQKAVMGMKEGTKTIIGMDRITKSIEDIIVALK